MTNNETPRGSEGAGIWMNLGVWIVFGAAFGVLVGTVFGNLALGTALGPGVGLVVGLIFIQNASRRGRPVDPPTDEGP
ncbi:hypothetical protein [Cryptosporangium sp. NPDC048952]|uniref:hypothetical protein n=1 Tax=Cryptosporangium sp. NPDC048952 TaxID=3363961 RepID=UPI0037244F59